MITLLDKLPNLPYTFKAVIILISGVILLRLAGKRAIAQLTVPEAILMIAVGTVLIQPLGQKSEWRALYGGALLVVGMLLLAYIQIIFPKIRKIVYGVPTVLITNGKIDVKKLKRTRMTTDELDMRLRQSKVENISDVKIAVLEPSGGLSVTLKEKQKNASKEDIQQLQNQIDTLIKLLSKKKLFSLKDASKNKNESQSKQRADTLFEEAVKEDKRNSNLSKED